MRRLVVAIALVACDGGSPPAEAAPTSAAPVEPTDENEAAAVLKALQGTYSMAWWRDGPEKHPEVWSIDGDTLVRWDGTKEEQGKITIVARCLARVDWASGTHTYEEFVIEGSTIWFGEEGGVTLNYRTVVCTSLGVYVLEGRKCTKWSPGGFSSHASGLSPESASCDVADDGAFVAGTSRWPRQGALFMRADFGTRKPTPPQRFDSLAAAKAALRSTP